jgi:hypothetical protein
MGFAEFLDKKGPTASIWHKYFWSCYILNVSIVFGPWILVISCLVLCPSSAETSKNGLHTPLAVALYLRGNTYT